MQSLINKSMIILGWLFILSIFCKADAVTIKEISIVSYGSYSARTDSNVSASFSSTGSLSLIKDLKQIKQSQTIKADIGTRFGIQFKVKGLPLGEKVPININVSHPPFLNPSKEKISCLDQWKIYPKLGEVVYTGWEFTQVWEIVPGLWTITISYQNKVREQKQFLVKLQEAENVFLIQTGAFKTLQNAIRFQNSLQKLGYPAKRLPYRDSEKGPLQLVYIAIARNSAQAQKLKRKYKSETNKDIYIHKISSDLLSKSALMTRP